MLGQLNSQVVLISMMAWVCTQGIVPFAIGPAVLGNVQVFYFLVNK